MPMINPDTTQAEELGAIEPGTYKAKISAVDAQVAKSSGNPMIVPTFDIDVNGKNRTRKAYLPITGAGAYGFDQLLRSTGFGDYADQLKAGDKTPWDTDNLIGQELNVVIVSDVYNGQQRDKVSSYLKA